MMAGEKSIAALVREALNAGAQTPREVHLLRPSVSISRARRALLDMSERGAVKKCPDGTYRGTKHTANEAAYRAHELAIRRAAALAKCEAPTVQGPDIESAEVQRAGAIISGAWG